jgi:hypothetical protein
MCRVETMPPSFTTASFTKQFESMGSYEHFAFFDGIAYRVFFFLMFLYGFMQETILDQVSKEAGENESANSLLVRYADKTQVITSLFSNVAAAVTLPYLYGALYQKTSLLDLTVIWRLTWVLGVILLTAAIGQNAFDEYCLLRLVFLVDVVGAAYQGLFLAPGSLSGAYLRLKDHMLAVIDTREHRYMHMEGFLGVIAGIVATTYTSFFSDQSLASFTVSIPVLFYMFLMWAAKDNDKVSINVSFISRCIVLGSVLYNSEIAGCEPFQHRCYAVALTFGIINPLLGLIGNSCLILYYYTLGFNACLPIEHGVFYWLIMGSVVTYAASLLWLWAFLDTYNEKQKARVQRTHKQDRLLCLYGAAVGGIIDRAGLLSTGFLGPSIGYAVPLGILWFTLETKFMTHIWVGTPYHPTWSCEGAPPGTPRYAWTDAVNWTFSFIAVVMTFGVTLYASYAVLVTLDSLEVLTSPFSTDLPLWKFVGTHGVLMVFHSGVWMMAASSGMPAWVERGKIPPEVPPVHQCNPMECVSVHKPDLYVGVFEMYFAIFIADKVSESVVLGTKFGVMLYWFLSLSAKVYVHYRAFKNPYPIKGKEGGVRDLITVLGELGTKGKKE